MLHLFFTNFNFCLQLCRYSAGDVLYNFRRKKPRTTITNCYCCGFIFKYIELGEGCTAFCDYSGEGEKIKGREPLINQPFNWGDECPQTKLDGDGNELPVESCTRVNPRLKTSTVKSPSPTTPKSKQTTTRKNKSATTQRTTTKNISKSERLVTASTTTQKTRATRRKEIFQNQRVFSSKRPSINNQGTRSPFSGALLITQPSVITSTTTTEPPHNLIFDTTKKTKLATTPSPKLAIKNIRKATTLHPKIQSKKDSLPIWSEKLPITPSLKLTIENVRKATALDPKIQPNRDSLPIWATPSPKLTIENVRKATILYPNEEPRRDSLPIWTE